MQRDATGCGCQGSGGCVVCVYGVCCCLCVLLSVCVVVFVFVFVVCVWPRGYIAPPLVGGPQSAVVPYHYPTIRPGLVSEPLQASVGLGLGGSSHQGRAYGQGRGGQHFDFVFHTLSMAQVRPKVKAL